MGGPSPAQVRSRLLRWFDAAHRDLPWRRTKDPYRILLAEYMLQRTRVVSGTPYYERFLERFPDVRSLAAAPEEDVLLAWEGLGFYRRARNLHRAARAIAAEHGGRIPRRAAELERLPGIGTYTAGAVASIAFGERVPAVDGNATRVISRLYRVEDDVTGRAGRERIRALAASLVPRSRPGAFNQALMEIGATVCTPTSPKCDRCPFGDFCLARKANLQAVLPRVPRRRAVTTAAVAFAAVERDGRFLLVRRPDGGLLGGLWSLPGGEVPVRTRSSALQALVRNQTGVEVDITQELARVAHTFSHRRWAGAIYRGIPSRDGAPKAEARWAEARELSQLPLVPFHRRFLEARGPGRPLESFDGGAPENRA